MATTIFDLGFTKQEPDSVLKVLVYVNLYSADDIQFTAYILLDDVIVQQSSVNIVLVDRNAQVPLTLPAYLPNVSAGYHNIKLSVQNTEQDNVNLIAKAGATIEITELKKAAR